MSKAKFLLFYSENEAKLVSASVKDGIATLDEKSFFVDQSSPIFLKGALSFKPLYIVKWSEIQPCSNFNPVFRSNGGESNTVKSKKPEFSKNEVSKDFTPELFRKIMGLKILGNMIKSKRNIELGGITMLLLGAGSAILILYALIYFGLLSF